MSRPDTTYNVGVISDALSDMEVDGGGVIAQCIDAAPSLLGLRMQWTCSRLYS